MNSKIIVNSSQELSSIESAVFQMMDDQIHVHVIANNHICDTGDGMLIFINNQHPSMRCILVAKSMMPEILALHTVLQLLYGVGLDLFCPQCGQQTLD